MLKLTGKHQHSNMDQGCGIPAARTNASKQCLQAAGKPTEQVGQVVTEDERKKKT
jgi:hypothetical protein